MIEGNVRRKYWEVLDFDAADWKVQWEISGRHVSTSQSNFG